ncbi:MAG TPA: asparagine synthase (glutamine-hydrolyzing) [Chitinophagales bacterium]|nr:asparagine synthase (glutamine-hydrolyzing) [Chitinophagales bacterium]
MCGICGFIALKDTVTDKHVLFVQNMASALQHRGPDHTGYWNNTKVALANPRLSIIDLSVNANLPMSSSEGDVWICYNGEVSNFKELSAKYRLRDKYSFKSEADTEVLIYLYKHLGISFLNELSGMFAFCLVDIKQDKAYIVRDFYGILPVYVYQEPKGIYFASEIKALLAIDGIHLTVNKTAIHHFFSLAYIPAELTPYNEITELKGGELIEIDLQTGANEKRRYYEFDYREDFSITEEDAILKTRELLISSVERNLISDAPLGMTLSGGIDTSAMLGIVKHLGLGPKMNTFSLKMGEKSFDESPYQRLMAKYAGSIHHEILVTPDEVIENILSQIAHTDEPNGNGACIPSFILAQKASKHVKVLLSGEGGDELFNAYPTIGAYQYRKLYRKLVPGPLRKLVKKGVENLPADYRKLSFDFKAKRFTAGAELDIPDSHLYWRHVFTESQKKQLLKQDYPTLPTEEYYRDIYYKSGVENEINRLSLIDMKHFFIDDLMVKNDRTFLANSVEGRFPFMDRMLVDYVTKLPVKYRVRGLNKLRWVEKEAMKPFMPEEIYKRGGFGLEMPHAIWFADKLGVFAKKYLNKEFVDKTEMLNWEYVEKIWKLHQSGKQDFGRPLWCVLNFLIWFDLFILQKNHVQYRVKR